MDILGFGGWEIFLIIVIALIVYGPLRIVEISRSLGKFMYNLKKTTSDLTDQIAKEIDEQKKLIEIKKSEDAGRSEDQLK
jgi:sec-independent protein translocase protein TatA